MDRLPLPGPLGRGRPSFARSVPGTGRGVSSRTPSKTSCLGLSLSLLREVDLSYSRSAQGRVPQGSASRILPMTAFVGCSLPSLWKDNESPVTLWTGGRHGNQQIVTIWHSSTAKLTPQVHTYMMELAIWHHIQRQIHP